MWVQLGKVQCGAGKATLCHLESGDGVVKYRAQSAGLVTQGGVYPIDFPQKLFYNNYKLYQSAKRAPSDKEGAHFLCSKNY